MTESLCNCHCGTRITLDEQLLEERQVWREKYLCLQKQAANDIGHLKENIYAECANLMQKQFSEKEAEQNRIVNAKNTEIQSLTSRIINLETKIKILEKENQILNQRNKELQNEVNDKDNAANNLKSKTVRSDREWETRLEEELSNLRKKLVQQYQEPISKLQSENEVLKQKVRQFQKKYQIIIPEVEKLKNSLGIKNELIQNLQAKLQKVTKESARDLLKVTQEKQDVEKAHSNCRTTISKLSDKTQHLSQQLQKSKKVKKEVRVQPVYIQRAVEVQKIVEKIVEVEKVVKQYIEPTSFRDEELEKENAQLKQQVNHLLRELHIFEEKYKAMISEYEDCIKSHEENVVKYKKERENLARTIEEQNKQIDMIHSYLEKRKGDARSSEPERIVVHVNKDGTYQKTIEKIPTAVVSREQSGKAAVKRK